jgi:hypothetical protein
MTAVGSKVGLDTLQRGDAPAASADVGAAERSIVHLDSDAAPPPRVRRRPHPLKNVRTHFAPPQPPTILITPGLRPHHSITRGASVTGMDPE